MAGILTRAQLAVLSPHLDGDAPVGDEWAIFCPLHDDVNKRSASLNVETGEWYCHACNFGANVEYLVSLYKNRPVTRAKSPGHSGSRPQSDEVPRISEGTITGWHSALMTSGSPLEKLQERRGLNDETLERFKIGWDIDTRAYTIPIRAADGSICNVRRYQLDVPDERRKIWSVRGMGTPTLYPLSALDDASEIIVCEGEWDALLTIQNGFPAVTRTGAAKVWKSAWNVHFDDKLVYVCHDMDDAGQAGNRIVVAALRKHAREVREVTLPYPVTTKHGKDLTDFWLEGNSPQDFKDLLNEAQAVRRDPAVTAKEFVDVNVLDSFDASTAGQRLRMKVTITGKRNPTYLLPKEAAYSCGQDAGAKCNICPMNDLGGSAVRTLESHDPRILEMMGATNKKVLDVLRRVMGAPPCERLEIDITESRTIEELYVRPSVDQSATGGDYTTRKIISVGRHDSLPNNTVEVVGAIFPNPKDQHNEFQAWEVTKTETSIDRFEVSAKLRTALKKFQPKAGQRPLAKLGEIARDLSSHVTKIYGRVEMHVLMDLVWHSALSFDFDGVRQYRGWLEALVVGDTRTGKSEAAEKLRAFYQAGELVSCESATFAGIVGGLQQMGSGREWEISWGVVPLNDRRLVVLDEVSGLQPEQIAQMSSIRSSGEAQLTKIRSERTWARTRLLWLGNPRHGRMADHTYGVRAVRPLIGNNEDIARFDLIMSVSMDDVDPEEINRAHEDTAKQIYGPEECHALVLWAWSRKPEHITWAAGAEAAVYEAALDLGKRYVEQPPLVQGANVRIKVARLAVAIACRLYSTEDGETVIVRKAHVTDAVKFIDKLYGMKSFGYKALSEEALQDLAEASRQFDAARQYLKAEPELAKFLRSMSSFRSNDLQDILNLSREGANAIVSQLWKMRMITRQGPEIRMNPLLHDILREVRDQ